MLLSLNDSVLLYPRRSSTIRIRHQVPYRLRRLTSLANCSNYILPNVTNIFGMAQEHAQVKPKFLASQMCMRD